MLNLNLKNNGVRVSFGCLVCTPLGKNIVGSFFWSYSLLFSGLRPFGQGFIDYLVIKPRISFFLLSFSFFSNIDRKDSGQLTQQQFRAAIEGRFELGMSDKDFEQLLKAVPINNEGMVKYVEFMSKFDTM